MSNMHGVNDYSRQRDNNQNSQFNIMGSGESYGDPRKEGFWSFLKNFCCPNFKFLSFIFIISCVDLGVYLITLFMGIKLSPSELLAPKPETLDTLGMKDPAKIQHGQVWRFVTYALLHANLVHIVVNLFSQIIIGSFIEYIIGSLKIALLYTGTAIGGCLFSCLVSNSTGVGASVAIYGLLAAYLGHMIMNWHTLDRTQGSGKYFNLMFILFIIFMNITIGMANPTVDNWGHLGGLIIGFFLIFVLHKPEEPGDGMCCNYNIWFWISVSFLVIFFILGLILFFTVRVTS